MIWVSIWAVVLMNWYGSEAGEWGVFCYLLINEVTSSWENITGFFLMFGLGGKRWPQQMIKALIQFLLFLWRLFCSFVLSRKGYLSEILSMYSPYQSQLEHSYPSRVTYKMFKDIDSSDRVIPKVPWTICSTAPFPQLQEALRIPQGALLQPLWAHVSSAESHHAVASLAT